MKRWIKGIVVAGACGVLATSASAADVSWYVDDGPDAPASSRWSDVTLGPDWEYMTVTMPEDDLCSIADLPWPPPPGVAYHACTPLLDADFTGYAFWAELWLVNNYDGHSNPVTVELYRGLPSVPGAFLASGSISVTSYPDPEMYMVNFGVFDPLVLTGESLIIKIIYEGEPGDTHIYWDAMDCPTGLFGEFIETPVEPVSWSRIKVEYR